MYLWMGEWKIRSESLRGSKLFLNFIPKELDHFYYKPIKVIPREIYQNEWWITCGLWRQTRPFRAGADTPLCRPQPAEGGPPSTGGWFPSPTTWLTGWWALMCARVVSLTSSALGLIYSSPATFKSSSTSCVSISRGSKQWLTEEPQAYYDLRDPSFSNTN